MLVVMKLFGDKIEADCKEAVTKVYKNHLLSRLRRLRRKETHPIVVLEETALAHTFPNHKELAQHLIRHGAAVVILSGDEYRWGDRTGDWVWLVLASKDPAWKVGERFYDYRVFNQKLKAGKCQPTG